MEPNETKPPALIFGGGINGLGIMRNLARERITVYLVVDRPDRAYYSKYCKKTFLLPDFTRRPDSVKSFLSRLDLSSPNRPIVFSTDDRTTLTLSALRNEIANRYNFVGPDLPCANTLVLKNKFYESLNKCPIQYPKVLTPRALRDLSQAGEQLGYPILVRPIMSQTFSDVMGSKGFLASSERDLISYCQIAGKGGLDVILQEFIPGPVSNILSVAGCFDGYSRPLALFAYRRLREWPPMIATSCLAESVPLAPFRNVVDPLLKYLTDIGYRGIMQATFKRDPRDGVYKLLEVNARSWRYNSFPTKCGLNIVWKAYLDSVGLDDSYTEEYSVGVKWINVLEDLVAAFTTHQVMKQYWIRSILGVRDYAFFDPNDPGPMVMGLPFNLGLLDREQGPLRPANLRRMLRQLP